MTTSPEFEIEMKRKNYTRAAFVAEESGLGRDDIDRAQELALKQAIGEWFNFRGARSLAEQWGVTPDRVRRLCDEIIDSFKQREEKEGRKILVFDIDRMDHTNVIVLIGHFRDTL
jgi:GTP cyclohydrolase I